MIANPTGLTADETAPVGRLSVEHAQILELTSENARLRAAVGTAHRSRPPAHNNIDAVLDSATNDAIIVTDLVGTITSWNRGAQNVLGWSDTEMLRSSVAPIFTREDRDAGIVEAEMRHVLADGQVAGERWYMKKDGSRIWASGTLTPLSDASGHIVGHLRILRDRTAQRRGDDAVLRREARLRVRTEMLEVEVAERTRERDRTWQLSQDLLAVSRRDGTLLATNPAWTSTLGWPDEGLTGRSLLELLHPADRSTTCAAVERLADGLPAGRVQNRLRHRDGPWRTFAWTAVAELGLIYATGRDVTAETEQADALRAAEEQLRQSQKMEAVGQLTGGIAHDFNNMLQGIAGSLDLLARRIEQGRTQDAARHIAAASKGVERAAALTHRLLAFARRQQLQPRPVEPDVLVEGVSELVRRTVGQGVAVALQLDAAAWPLLCDPGQLESVILNLAINARDAMPNGGRLTIRTRQVILSAADLAGQDGVEPGDFIEITVSDNGTGMTPDVLARAFEPFFTTKPIGQGTGLGLSQLYGFVRQTGGTVRLESAPGRGTTVRLCLPRYMQPIAVELRPETGVTSAHAARGATVLLIEDEEGVRAPVAEHMRDLGYRVIEAGDGPSGLVVLRSDQAIDLLVTDVGLPGLNGRQVAEMARERRPNLPILFITGYAGGAVERSLPHGMAVLSKPFALDGFAERVRTMLDETSP